MILGRKEIHKRLKEGQIFKECTWKKKCLREASYALRIADDGLLLNGKFYDPGDHYKDDFIVIDPGKIAILSTKEEITMPADLVGKIGIRLDYALLGLTGLMGIQVDPYYGHDKERERLYIRVANFGNAPIRLSPGDEVFTFELHEVKGKVPKKTKQASWTRIKQILKDLDDASWSYVTGVEDNLSTQTDNLRHYLQPLVMFGVFLVAVTILGVTISFLMDMPNEGASTGSPWPATDLQNPMFWVLLVGILGTAWIGLASGWRFLRPYRTPKEQPHTGWIRKYWRKLWGWLW